MSTAGCSYYSDTLESVKQAKIRPNVCSVQQPACTGPTAALAAAATTISLSRIHLGKHLPAQLLAPTNSVLYWTPPPLLQRQHHTMHSDTGIEPLWSLSSHYYTIEPFRKFPGIKNTCTKSIPTKSLSSSYCTLRCLCGPLWLFNWILSWVHSKSLKTV